MKWIKITRANVETVPHEVDRALNIYQRAGIILIIHFFIIVNTGDSNTQQQLLVEFASRIKDFDAFLTLSIPSIIIKQLLN